MSISKNIRRIRYGNKKKETVKLTNVLFGEKTFSAIEQNVGADVDSLDEVIDGNKNVVKSNNKLLIWR